MWMRSMPKLIVDNDMQKTETVSDQFLITKEFKGSSDFSQHIEKKAVSGGNYIDVLVEYCTKNGIEIESVKKLLTASLKEKIKAEAIDLNLVKGEKSCKLPL